MNWSKQPHGHKWRCPNPDDSPGFTDQIKRATDLWREAAHRSVRQTITTLNCGEVLRFTGKCPVERKNTTAEILWHARGGGAGTRQTVSLGAQATGEV